MATKAPKILAPMVCLVPFGDLRSDANSLADQGFMAH
jgi:hypothetical protein